MYHLQNFGGDSFTDLKHDNVVHLFEETDSVCDENHGLVLQKSVRTNHILEDVLAYVGVNSTEKEITKSG